MSASPVPAGKDADPPATLAGWLRAREDAELVTLLRLRPDVALPAPADFGALAARLSVRTSTQRAVDALDAGALHELAALVLAADGEDTVRGPAGDAAAHTGEALSDLLARALVWGEPGRLHLTPTVRDAVGPYPDGLGRPAAQLFDDAAPFADPGWVAEQLAGLDADERRLVERLAAGPPVGTLTSAADDGSAAHRLRARGLLATLDPMRVELPRELALAVRGPIASPEPPVVREVPREPAELDRLGTTAVLEALRLVESLADSWAGDPPPTLRSGGLGVRDLRRAAKDLGVDEATAALVIEVAYAAGLVNSTSEMDPVLLPTPEYDEWRRREPATRWMTLANAWLTMTRQPSLVGERGDRDRVIAALGPDLERGLIPTMRRQVLGRLAGLRPGAAPASREEVLDLLAWHQPRRASGHRALAAAILGEADLLGVTAAGGLTGYSRTLLSGSAAAAEHALDNALPAPVDHFLVQPDLTVVVPGPPEPTLGLELGLVADLESTGGASVYRITERSVRRALDAGRSGEQLAAFVASRSRTPVPQALRYLIDDAARRHGVLRAGTAGCYLRCDDESLLARVVSERATSSLNLRLLAPTVVVSDASITKVLGVLRDAGFAPAAEGADGTLVTLGAEPSRAPNRQASRPSAVRSDPDAQLGGVVRRLRSSDALAGLDPRVQQIARDIPSVTSAATMELLRSAIRDDRTVWFGAADADGSSSAHVMAPISLAGGMLRGYERGRPGLASYPVHRITAIRLLDDDEEL